MSVCGRPAGPATFPDRTHCDAYCHLRLGARAIGCSAALGAGLPVSMLIGFAREISHRVGCFAASSASRSSPDGT
jgi:hypothetical protein